jgi:hypothetical protein
VNFNKQSHRELNDGYIKESLNENGDLVGVFDDSLDQFTLSKDNPINNSTVKFKTIDNEEKSHFISKQQSKSSL